MAYDSDSAAPVASSFRQSTWSTRVILAGICVLAVCRFPYFLPRDWAATVPWWLLFVLTGIIPYLFMPIYPLVTRKQPEPNRFRLPRMKRFLIEAVIAVPVLFGCLILVSSVVAAIAQLSPETPIVPEGLDRLARSTGTPFIYGFLLVSFSYGPIAEEVFFRGFLFNAFHKRMSLVVAVLLQTAIFGLVHLPSPAHAIVAGSLGLVLTLVYCWRQTIVAPILVHAGFNGLWALGMFLTISANANAPGLGVTAQESAAECVIGTVLPNSPAEAAGLLPGDTIRQVDDYPITDIRNLIDTLSYYEAGDTVVVTVSRNGEVLQIEVVLATRSSLSTP